MVLVGEIVENDGESDRTGEQLINAGGLTNINELAQQRRLVSASGGGGDLLAVAHVIGAAIQQCDDVEELRRTLPTADYLKELMRRADASLEQLNEAALLRLRTMHRIGCKLIEMNLQGGDHKSKLHAATLKLADLKLDKYFSCRCRKIAALNAAEIDAAAASANESGRELTAALMYRLADSSRPEKRGENAPEQPQDVAPIVPEHHEEPSQTSLSVPEGCRVIDEESLLEVIGNFKVLSQLLSGPFVARLVVEAAEDSACVGAKSIPRYLRQLQESLDALTSAGLR